MMQDFTLLGVSRGTCYSPNHIGNDEAIFREVVAVLKEQGYEVSTCTEKEVVKEQRTADVIFTMARAKSTLTYLQELELKGALVINSTFGIHNCVRKPMTELLLEANIPHPPTWIYAIEDVDLSEIVYPCWFKRGDSHALIKEDVSFIRDAQEAQTLLLHFKKRGIDSVVINQHMQGDLVKFYGVQETGYFYWFYPSIRNHSKFGWEEINGVAKEFAFSAEELHRQCDLAADVLSVPIYGGDCVVRPDGSLSIIDFNDWPSFARCREEAGRYIAQCIQQRVSKKYSRNKMAVALKV